MKIHHNTAKKAKTHGITLTVEDNVIVASKDGVTLTSGMAGNKVLDDAIAKLRGAEIDPAPKAPKAAKTPRKAKVISEYETAARAEGWVPVRGGGFKQADAGDDEGGTSEAATWKALCKEQEIEVEAEEGSKSIVKPKYRAAYKPHKMTNGDDLAAQLKDYLMISENEDGKPCVDLDLLRRFAKANGCWIEGYAKLNPGQQRMNVGNRLRALVRKDPEFKIDWV